VRPAQSSQILPTRRLVGKPRPELLIGPRIVTTADRTPNLSHDRHGTALKRICRTQIRFRMEEKRRQATLLAMPVPRETARWRERVLLTTIEGR
jgi:hypothetical protein